MKTKLMKFCGKFDKQLRNNRFFKSLFNLERNSAEN